MRGRESPSSGAKYWIAALLLLLLLVVTACGQIPEQTKKSWVRGTVEDVMENTFILLVDEGEEERNSSDRISVPLTMEGEIPAPVLQPGDRTAVCYDGVLAESYPAQIHRVYEIRVLYRENG